MYYPTTEKIKRHYYVYSEYKVFLGHVRKICNSRVIES